MIKGKTGSLKPIINGLRFESRTTLKNVISAIQGYEVKDDVVYFKGNKVAELYQKNKLYKNLLEPQGVDYKKIISKRLLPDDAILILKDEILFIIEIKFQEVSGSVDEKLQTCDFKNQQYTKLLAPLNISVKYTYILNDWFKKDEYKDVLSFIKSVGCYYFFDELPFDFLGLPKP
ncbi:MAG: hypothetical protein PHS93_00460 [Candidatus Omnitrophica bacterium]|nr:hypothetical protein [Candidatus Omnitrophota bacterium]MDD5351627.1 hypothetical protein [Candidatus Omnitrophota bacterium]MDD5550837.1 hypothetical protein [Candidatus Omnitrophota bacterium]